MLELYQAYTDVEGMLELTESLVIHLVERVKGTPTIQYQGQEIRFTRPFARLEMVEVDVQQRRAGRGDAAAQRLIDVIDVVEMLRVVQIDDQMHAGAAHAVADHEVVLAVVNDSRNSRRLVFLSGGTWDPQALVRSQEGVLAHAVLPNQEKEPEMPASRRHGKRKPPDPVRFGLIYSGKTPK